MYDKIQHYQVVSSVFNLKKNEVSVMDDRIFGKWKELEFFGLKK